MTRPRTAVASAALLAVAAVLLAGCASGTSAAAPPASTPSASTSASAAAFPLTLEVPAGTTTPATEVTIPAEPQRIAALSYETVAAVTELGLADHIVMMPAEATNPALTDHASELASVETTFPSASKVDPELVIAQHPDLVLLTARHGLEDGLADTLRAAGLPVLVLPGSWSTTDDVRQDVSLIARATGAEKAGAELDQALADGWKATKTTDAPRILILSNQAGRPFVTAGSAFPLELVHLAGGTDASSELGIRSTGPITAEQLVQANPDAILLVDMNGSGEKIFASVLDNPAVAALPAVANHKTLLLQGKDVQALGLTDTIAGLSSLTSWISGL